LPNLLSLATSCVGPELRPLPSTGITRLRRYYEPLRHPRAAGPSLTGVRLVIADRASGLPVLRALPLCTCCRHYPGAAARCFVCSLPQPCQPSPIWQSGRPARRPFRGLSGVHSRYGLHTRAATVFRGTLHRRLQPFRYLHSCSGCFRLELSPGGTFTHWESAALSRRTPEAGTVGPEVNAVKRTFVWPVMSEPHATHALPHSGLLDTTCILG
jgi:hypothetical protein